MCTGHKPQETLPHVQSERTFSVLDILDWELPSKIPVLQSQALGHSTLHIQTRKVVCLSSRPGTHFYAVLFKLLTEPLKTIFILYTWIMKQWPPCTASKNIVYYSIQVTWYREETITNKDALNKHIEKIWTSSIIWINRTTGKGWSCWPVSGKTLCVPAQTDLCVLTVIKTDDNLFGVTEHCFRWQVQYLRWWDL